MLWLRLAWGFGRRLLARLVVAEDPEPKRVPVPEEVQSKRGARDSVTVATNTDISLAPILVLLEFVL